MYGRKTNLVTGWVYFPVGSPQWPSTGEGGMVVKLVVVDRADADPSITGFGVCSGAYVSDILSEGLVGDDRRPKPASPQVFESAEAVMQDMRNHQEWEAYHFPQLHDSSASGLTAEKYISRPYLAALVLGSTGWSGVNKDTHDLWQCSFEDLTEEGKQLYRQMQVLYPSGELHLLTFLDT